MDTFAASVLLLLVVTGAAFWGLAIGWAVHWVWEGITGRSADDLPE